MFYTASTGSASSTYSDSSTFSDMFTYICSLQPLLGLPLAHIVTHLLILVKQVSILSSL